VLGKFSSE
jgi:hypothetical protein